MSTNKWTDEQFDAISSRDCNLLVAAGAGAGKTAVLVERIIRIVTDEENPVDIDRLLVMTFTRAAATEMRERIGHAISKALDSNPGSKVLQRQIALLNKASITTIHSFCLEVIRNNFQKAGIDPNFRIADDTEALLLKLESIEELFDEVFEDAIHEDTFENSDFYKLLECYGANKDDMKLKDMVLNLYEFIQSYPWPQKWLEEHSSGFCADNFTDFANTVWGQVIVKNVYIEICGLKDAMEEAVNRLNEDPLMEGYYKRFKCELDYLMDLQSLLKLDGNMKWDALCYGFSGFKFDRLPPKPKEASEGLVEYVKQIREKTKTRINKFVKDIFTYESEDVIESFKKLYPLINALNKLVMDFTYLYNQKKLKKSILDFGDLEHYALKILTKVEDNNTFPSDVAMAYKEKVVHLLVDEYQDSNYVQEILIKMISREDLGKPNVFMVGDVKQSIYRFRQAKPELFLEKYNSYKKEKGESYRKIMLYKNFRSRYQVIDAVNYIFKQIMSKELGELEYDDVEALLCGASYEEGDADALACEVHLIDTSDTNPNASQIEEDELIEEEFSENNPNNEFETEFSRELSISSEDITNDEPLDEEFLDNITTEARFVAQKINSLIGENNFKIFDKSEEGQRSLQFKDIVILLRTTSNWADIFVEELSSYGIPVFADSNTGFFKTMEVNIVMSLLELIDNPYQDIPLLSVLRCPVYSWTSEELADLRIAASNKHLLYGIYTLAAMEGETAFKAKRFAENLEKWRIKAQYLSTDELIWYLYDDTSIFSFVGAMPYGKQRQANLRVLFERARQYEKTSFKGLFNFINFINKLKIGKGDLSSAKTFTENENVVRIMSIHKSKGLEFPVVILSGCGKGFNLQDLNKKMILHQELGFGPDVVDLEKRIFYPSLPKQALRFCIKSESLSEELRILYVAMTRAREKLIITGSVKNFQKSVEKWALWSNAYASKIPAYRLYSGKSFLDFLMPALVRHKESISLRNYLSDDYKGALISDNSKWQFKLSSKADLIPAQKEAVTQVSDILNAIMNFDPNTIYSDNKEVINTRLQWEYAYKKSHGIPSKVSVTELKKRFAAVGEMDALSHTCIIAPLVKKPMFLEERDGLDYAQKGTVLHFVMQNLNLKKVENLEEISLQIQKMIEKDLLTKIQGETIDVRRIIKFFASDIGKRMLLSKNVMREMPFNLEVKSNLVFKELTEEIYNDEIVLLQGVIDCCFEEGDNLVLLDYKTDFVPTGDCQIIKERYRLQMDYYKLALEKLTGKEVIKRSIYLFFNGETVDF